MNNTFSAYIAAFDELNILTSTSYYSASGKDMTSKVAQIADDILSLLIRAYQQGITATADMDEKVKERQNEALWLQGLYFYEALVDASPVLNAMSKKHKPIPYRQAPIPLTEARHRQQQEEENHKKLNAGKEAMKQIMAGVNSKFKRKEE